MSDDKQPTPPGLSSVTGNRYDGDSMLTFLQLCALLNLTEAQGRRRRILGDFPIGYRLGKVLRFRQSDVLAWLESKREEEP